MGDTINLKLKIWRQKNSKESGRFEIYDMPGVNTHMSFLEMLDVLNDRLIREGKDPVAFDHDCREGICGMCSMYINGRAHGMLKGTTTCQLHMRHFHDGETVTIEPWRATAFPVIRDLVVDRTGFEKIMQAGGYVSVNIRKCSGCKQFAYRHKVSLNVAKEFCEWLQPTMKQVLVVVPTQEPVKQNVRKEFLFLILHG